MTAPAAPPPAARRADQVLVVVALALFVLPGLGLLLNAVAPVLVPGAPAGPSRWRWTWTRDEALDPDRPEPVVAAEERLLPRACWSQLPDRERELDRRNLAMRLAPVTRPGRAPKRPGAKTALRDFVGERFGARGLLMTAGAWLKVDLLGVTASSRVILGRDGWLYYDAGAAHRDDLRGCHPFTPAELAALVATFRRNRDHLAERGIPYLVLLCPGKPTIHPEHLPGWIRPTGGPTRREQLVAALAAAGIEHLDLAPVLERARLDGWPERVRARLGGAAAPGAEALALYQRTDTHWNDLGAFRAYRALAGYLREHHLPDLEPLSLEDMEVALAPRSTAGDLAGFLYKRQDPAWRERLAEIRPAGLPGMIDEGNIDPLVDTGTGRADQPAILVLRDSFCQRLIPYLSQHCSFVRYRWHHRLLTALPVRWLVLPRWLPLDEGLVRRALGPGPPPLMVERGPGLVWSGGTGVRSCSPDVDLLWPRQRGDRPAIVIHQLGERTLVETPAGFGDPDAWPGDGEEP